VDGEPYDEDSYYEVRVSLNIKVMELQMSSKTGSMHFVGKVRHCDADRRTDTSLNASQRPIVVGNIIKNKNNLSSTVTAESR